MSVLVHGKCDTFQGQRQMTSPTSTSWVTRPAGSSPCIPSRKSGLLTKDLARFVEEAVARCRPRGLDDPVPDGVLDRFDFVDRAAAVFGIHQPNRWPRLPKPAGGSCSTSCCGCSSSWFVASAVSSGRRRVSPTRSPVNSRPLHRTAAVPAHQPRSGRSVRLVRISNSPDPCIVFCRAMLVPARHWWRCTRSSRRCRVGIRVR